MEEKRFHRNLVCQKVIYGSWVRGISEVSCNITKDINHESNMINSIIYVWWIFSNNKSKKWNAVMF